MHCVYVGFFFVIVFPIYFRGNGTKAQRQRNIMHIINNSMGLVSLIIAIVREWEQASERAKALYLTLCPENGNWVDFDHAVVLLPIHTVHSSFDMALDNRNESMKSISIFHAIYRNDWDCVVLICCVAADVVVVVFVLFIVISMLWMREMNDILWREALYEKYREEIEKKKLNEWTNEHECSMCQFVKLWMDVWMLRTR